MMDLVALLATHLMALLSGIVVHEILTWRAARSDPTCPICRDPTDGDGRGQIYVADELGER